MKTPVANEHNPQEDLKDVSIINFPSFIVPAEENEQTEKGIFLPKSSEEDEEEKVFYAVKVSPKCKYLREGDKVLLRDGTKPAATFTRNNNMYFLYEEISVVVVIGREVEEFEYDKEK